MISRFLAALLVLFPIPAFAASASGVWVVRAGDIALFQFEVSHTPTGWTGIWSRPSHFNTDGETFSEIKGPVVRRIARSARVIGEAVELTFDDPRPNATPDVFLIRASDANHAEARFAETAISLVLVREATGATLGGWDAGRTYVQAIERPTNPEMTAIFEADQKPRVDWAKADTRAVTIADRGRRARTEALLDAGALNSGADFYHAAFVFQHGDKPDDYLKAHLLAVVAASRGHTSAPWIAAATLDRYLQSIGQSQVLGTQFQTNRDGKTTQEPYSRALVSDGLRQALRVPTLSAQEEQRKVYEREAAAHP